MPRNGGERHIRLSDILSEEAMKAVVPVMNDIQRGRIDISEGKKRLLKIFEPMRDELVQKGVLPDYLAWYLAYIAGRGGGELGRVSMIGDR